MSDTEDVARRFILACRAANINYAMIGGLAVIAWGQPRMTMDVDALVTINTGQFHVFAEALNNYGFIISGQDMETAAHERSHATAFDRTSNLHVDIKFATSKSARQEVMAATEITLPYGTMRVARPEDVVAWKLRFGSSQDIADAKSILIRQANRIDPQRLRKAASELAVTVKLNRLLRKITPNTSGKD